MAKKLEMNNSDFPEKALLTNLRIGIVKTAWNRDIVEPLFNDCISQLLERGIQENNITVQTVPGAFELAHGAQQVINSSSSVVCITLGALIKGDTYHFEVLAHAVAAGLQTLSLQGTPIIFGVLTCNREQALERVQNGIAKGWADSALMMVPKPVAPEAQKIRQVNL